MGYEAAKLLLEEIENETDRGHTRLLIEEEFLWRKSVKRKV